MHLSAAGLECMKKAEGFRNRAYKDVAGIPTIGYGHRLLPGESFPGGIGHAQAETLLLSDVRLAEQALERLVKVPLAQGQFDALVDFIFNLGAGRFASSTLLKDLNAGRYDAAAGQLLHWDFAGKSELPSLKARREAELRLWHGGSAPQQALA
jgi:lysozyme